MRRRAATVAIACVLAGGAAHAQDTPLSLAETLRLAVAHSQQLVSQRAMVDAAREMAVAGRRAARSEAQGRRRERADRRRRRLVAHARLHDDVEDRADAGIPARGKAQAQGAARRARRRARRSVAVESTTLAVQRDAATAWLARRYAADAERVIAAQIAEAELAVTTVAAAYRAGKAPQSELIAAQSMVIDLRNRATDAATQSRRARIALARYIGADADRPLGRCAGRRAGCRTTRASPTSTRSRS